VSRRADDQRISDSDQAQADRDFADIEAPTAEDERQYEASKRGRDTISMARGENLRSRARASRDRDAATGQRHRTGDARDHRRQPEPDQPAD
jgi:hypothetical protein